MSRIGIQVQKVLEVKEAVRTKQEIIAILEAMKDTINNEEQNANRQKYLKISARLIPAAIKSLTRFRHENKINNYQFLKCERKKWRWFLAKFSTFRKACFEDAQLLFYMKLAQTKS